MTTTIKVGALVLAATALAAGGGYWYGQRQSAAHGSVQATSTVASANDKKERKVLYYRNPMGLPDTSPTPKKDPMGMDYIRLRGRSGTGSRKRQPDQDQHRQGSEARGAR